MQKAGRMTPWLHSTLLEGPFTRALEWVGEEWLLCLLLLLLLLCLLLLLLLCLLLCLLLSPRGQRLVNWKGRPLPPLQRWPLCCH
jgi:hypothetical protein